MNKVNYFFEKLFPCLLLLFVPFHAEAAAQANPGNTAWLLVASTLVILMAIPGLAMFYGGLVRAKNMLSVLMQVFVVFAIISLLWVVYGYSLAFTEGNSVIGSFGKMFLKGITTESLVATFSKGVVIPELVYVVFQGAFAAITCGLIIGAFAERAKFSAVLLFVIIWFTFSYLPIAHMVWYWDGPDSYSSAEAAAIATLKAGYLFQKGALDFAGGTVVHINAAVAGLVGAYMVGKRIGFGRESMAPHNLTTTMIGASLLWFGWFGFNAGSALEANGAAALALLNTWLATSVATLTWLAIEWKMKGKPSMLGAASGAVSGLVAITPACGFVGVFGAILIGAASGVLCLWGVNGLKRLLRADDALDVFGIHGVGGILGALLTAIFASPTFGGSGIYNYVTNSVDAEYSITSQLLIQFTAVSITVILSAVVSLIAYKLVDLIIGLRVDEESEREGLDISAHGESAYHR